MFVLYWAYPPPKAQPNYSFALFDHWRAILCSKSLYVVFLLSSSNAHTQTRTLSKVAAVAAAQITLSLLSQSDMHLRPTYFKTFKGFIGIHDRLYSSTVESWQIELENNSDENQLLCFLVVAGLFEMKCAEMDECLVHQCACWLPGWFVVVSVPRSWYVICLA